MSKEHRKRAVSIRMSGSDVGKVKRLAERLGVRDSDVIRYAVKSMLAKLAPLHDPQVRGRGLLPVFVESGADLFLHFELDANRLEDIINEETDEELRVDHEDIQLIAMNGVSTSYGSWRSPGSPVPTLRVRGTVAPQVQAPAPEPTAAASTTGAAGSASSVLRDYLYAKYVNRTLVDA